jgi:hypothetical protein
MSASAVARDAWELNSMGTATMERARNKSMYLPPRPARTTQIRGGGMAGSGVLSTDRFSQARNRAISRARSTAPVAAERAASLPVAGRQGSTEEERRQSVWSGRASPSRSSA